MVWFGLKNSQFGHSLLLIEREVCIAVSCSEKMNSKPSYSIFNNSRRCSTPVPSASSSSRNRDLDLSVILGDDDGQANLFTKEAIESALLSKKVDVDL